MPTIKRNSFIVFAVLVVATICSCADDYSPKPRGYYRIDFPQKQYRLFDSIYPFRFNVPIYAKAYSCQFKDMEGDFINIDINRHKARIHLTYRNIHNNLDIMVEDAFTMAYKHTQKAESIEEQVFVNDKKRVYGLLYDIRGNSASSVQFYLTDSLTHYIRGALYFNCQPNKDSLAPAIDFFRSDVIELIESLEWKR